MENQVMPRSSGASRPVFVIGDSRLQNDLLASHIEERLRCRCAVGASLDSHQVGKEPGALVLRDCLGKGRDDLKALCRDLGRYSDDGTYFTLFNLDPDAGIERLGVKSGLRAFFYVNEPIGVLLKGVKAVMDGEVWLPRKAVADLLFGAPGEEDRDGNPCGLTARELEVLARVVEGATNEEIATELFISINTVKAHLHHVFKKIGASNRLQAVLWASQNL